MTVQSSSERALARAHVTAAPVEEQQPGRALSLLVPGQERRSWRPGALARVKAGVVLSRLSPLIGHSSGGCCGTRAAASTGKGARMQAECPQGVPFRTQHPLGVVVNRPSVWPDR